MSRAVERLLPLVLAALLGCDHTEPFAYTPPPPLGPRSTAVPRQITFNPGDDRFPSVQGDVVVYSFHAPERADGDWCVAVLPDTGGQRVHELCPPGPADNYRDSYRYPAGSPDTQSVIFWKERGLTSNLVPAERGFVRVEWARADSQVPVLSAPYFFPDSTAGNSVRQVTWPAAGTLRFVAGVEYVDLFTTDTVFTPSGIAELDLSSGRLTMVSGTAGLGTYANAADGGVWFMAADGRTVQHVAPGAAKVDTVAVFPYLVAGLANAGGMPVAIVDLASGGGVASPALGYVNPGDATFHVLWTGPAPVGVAASAASAVVVAQVVRVGSSGSGNLWMVAK